MAEIRHALGVSLRLAGATMRGHRQYKASFLLTNLFASSLILLDLTTVLVLLSHSGDLVGWDANEIVLFYGFSRLAFDLSSNLAEALESLDLLIRQGTLDRILVRPVAPLWQIVGEFFEPRRLLRIPLNVAIVVIGLVRVEASWSPVGWLYFIVSLVLATAVYCAVWVITGSASVWLVRAGEIRNAFTYGGQFMSQFPLGIYPGWMRGLLVYVLPLAFVAYVPLAVLLGKPVYPGRWAAFAAPVVTVALLFAAAGVWRLALRHYRSTGS